MFYPPYPPPGADARRGAAIAAALATRGIKGLSQELVDARRAVLDCTEFSESALRIGQLLGFDATAVGTDVHWAVHDEKGDATDEGWAIAGANEAVTYELAGAADRMRKLLGELRWRAILPRVLVSHAIEHGLSRHDLTTTRLLERLTDAD